MNTSAKGSRAENERKGHYERLGYLVQRSAGSHGVCDLVLIGEPGFPPRLVEVKSTSSRVWRASRSSKERGQYDRMLDLQRQIHHVYYDVRFKGGVWVSFDQLPEDGILRCPEGKN